VAKKYYTEFKSQMADLPGDKKLKVATILQLWGERSDDEDNGIIKDENLEDTSCLDQSSRDFLELPFRTTTNYSKPISILGR
jgi:type I restriction enzyme R subunit